MNSLLNRFFHLEKFLFLAFTLANLHPAISTQFFLTLDGPAHVYNANILHSLVTGQGPEIINDYYQINPYPVPNWSGHVLLAIFISMFPGYVAEKILLVSILVALPFAFRYFIKSVGGQLSYSYLIFPFTFCSPFTLGFYNFMLGLVFLFLAIGLGIRQIDKNHVGFRNYLLFLLIFFILYFSHLFLFAFSLAFLGLYVTHRTISDKGLKNPSGLLVNIFTRLKVIIPAIPFIIMSFLFYGLHSDKNSYSSLTTQELTDGLINVNSIISYVGEEKEYTRWLFMFCVVVTLTAIIYHFVRRKRKVPEKSKPSVLLFTGIITLILLIIYYILPDSNKWSGYFSMRLQLLFYLFWFTGLSLAKLPRWIGISGIFAATGVVFMLMKIYMPFIRENSATAKEIHSFDRWIEPGSIVHYDHISPGSNWLLNNAAWYVGIDKKFVMPGDYESNMGYFPVKWRKDGPQIDFYNISPLDSCTVTISSPGKHPRIPDYLFLEGFGSSGRNCTSISFDTPPSLQLVHKTWDRALFKRI